MKSDSIKKNMTFQFAYQIVILIVPLIMAPYLTRSLGETSIGVYSYTYSIAYYYVLFCMLGIARYGQRIIAERKDDTIALRKTFWSLYVLHAIVSVVGFLFYLLFCELFCNDNIIIYLSQSLYVLSALFDITWLFYGIEKFKIVVIRNAVVKVLELIFVFVFVKNPNDLIKYTFIMAISALISQASLFPTVINKIKPIKFGKKDILEHIKPLFVLSVSVLAISMFTVFDKTLLGIMTTKDNVAFYEYANKIINIPKMFIVVIGTVLFPRACSCIANNDIDGVKKYYKYSILVVYLIAVATMFGLLGIADLFATVYFGESFAICGTVIKSLTPIILIIGLGDVFRTQFLIPLKKDFSYTFCVIINAVINIVLSLLLIPKLGIYGAVIGTLSAEMFGVIYQGYLIRNYINIKQTIIAAIPFFVAGAGMLILVNSIKTIYNLTIFDLLIQVIFGATVYIVILYIWFLVLDHNRMEYRKIVKSVLKKSANKTSSRK